MSNRFEIRPFARLYENRGLLYRAGAAALGRAIDWPKMVVAPVLPLEGGENMRDSNCFAPAEFADDMGRHGMFALPYDKFVVIMGPCPASDRMKDDAHWVSTVEKAGDRLVGRSWIVGSDFYRNGAGIWSFQIGSDRNDWIDNSEPPTIDEEAMVGPDAIISSGDSEENAHRLLVERFIWLTSVFQCVGLLSSKGVASEMVSAPRSLNKKREQKCMDPIFSYRLLTINPQEANEARGEVRGTHASPRLHWRRGHIRTMSDGRQTIVRPCLVGSIERGYIAKDYKVANAPIAQH